MVLFPLSPSCFDELLSITLKKAHVTLENAGLHHSKEDSREYFILWAMVLIKASGMENCSSSYITGTHCSKSSFFVQKFNFDFPRKLSIFWGEKTRENVVVLDFLAVDNFDFTRKIVNKKFGEKLVKMLWFCQY